MCGIAGYTTWQQPSAELTKLEQMGEAIFHRGPDAGSVYFDDNIGMVHRRLATIDLS